MDDLISRKQVLNASHFVACWDGVEHFSLEVVDADFIQKLPSVQSTQTNAQSTQINVLDCVSRQTVIDESCINHNALLQIADITDFLYENTNTDNCADVTHLMTLAEIKGIVDFAKKLKQLLREV